MNNKIIILILTVSSLVFGLSASVSAAEGAKDPLSTQAAVSPSSSDNSKIDYLGSSRQSIGASTSHQTISASPQSILRSSDEHASTWGNADLFLPGGNGWEQGQTGNVGYPVGDASGAMLLLMVVIYFVYRGVSSTKRRNNI